jgi:hypothetical protein
MEKENVLDKFDKLAKLLENDADLKDDKFLATKAKAFFADYAQKQQDHEEQSQSAVDKRFAEREALQEKSRQEREARRAQMRRMSPRVKNPSEGLQTPSDVIEEMKSNREKAGFQNFQGRRVPDPVVLRSDGPVKGMKILSEGNLMLIGMDSGEIKVVNKLTLQVLST